MSNVKHLIHAYIFAGITFVLSIYVFPYYVSGDQLHYRLFYEEINNFSIGPGFIAYRNYLGASEPVYFFIVYFLNRLIEKDLLFSIINGLFAFFLAKNMLRLRISIPLLYCTLINFYFVVLLFSAERLKLSLLFFLIAILYKNSLKQYAFISFSILSHFQSLILVYVEKFNELKTQIVKYFRQGNLFKIFLTIAAAIGFVAILFVMRGYLQDKLLAYSDRGGIQNVIKPIVFCFLAMYYSKEKLTDVFLMFLPLIFSSIVVGEERIVIFCYGIFMYFAIQVKGEKNWGYC
ncbi:hypothetical protein KUH03_17660 [Sphingobacterium sp. E70]|uniref:hypothetical protein n=1 Tax=Sphingobacterium sp. E70 TaxID=2853439 RepID=UPI00211C9808|nr:hypothetical protein [Sphingobacterium sp. E70]ULT28253.1 hypothetical protein KUH03_17660 [Sphingobacterium sp. E70]